MCYHINAKIENKSKTSVEELFNSNLTIDEIPSYDHINGFQRPEMLIITQEEPDLIQKGVWSIAPPNCNILSSYWKEKKGSALNTRDDSLFTNKSANWKSSTVLTQKCLVIVTGFFEPHKVNKISYPYLLERPNKEIFALLGYYTKQNEGLLTFSILTTNANEYLSKVHNEAKRMPLTVLPENKQSIFDLTTEEDLKNKFSLNYSIPLEAKAVSRDIFNSRIHTNSEKYTNEIFHPIITEF